MAQSLKKTQIAVVGATGNVGRVILSILAERGVPSTNVTALASPRSLGKPVSYGDNDTLKIKSLKDFDFSQVEIAFFAAGSGVSAEYALQAAQKGCLVIDKSSLFRMNEQVPLIVPEVNADSIANPPLNIIANPNCTTIPLVAVLKPLHEIATLKRVVVSTYQSVSGAGKEGMDELYNQTRSTFMNAPTLPRVFLKPIAFNVIPHIDDFCSDGFTKEEHKMMNETKKILNIPVAVVATCVRVPVFIGHSLSVVAEFENPIEVRDALQALKKAPGLQIIDDINEDRYITPIECAGDDVIVISRIRKDFSTQNSLAFWVCCDNLRKGAALNAIQIAETALKNNMISIRN